MRVSGRGARGRSLGRPDPADWVGLVKPGSAATAVAARARTARWSRRRRSISPAGLASPASSSPCPAQRAGGRLERSAVAGMRRGSGACAAGLGWRQRMMRDETGEQRPEEGHYEMEGAEPLGATTTWLHLPYGSRDRLQRWLLTWSCSKNMRLAGLRPEPLVEPLLEPCQTGPYSSKRSEIIYRIFYSFSNPNF